MNRRDALKLGAGSLSCLAAAAGLSALGTRPARADDWPSKNVRVIVPYGAGSATDLIPRTIFEAMGARLGHSFIVENRLGITPLANVPLVLVIAPEKNVKSVQELIALAKQKAGAINYAAAGIGTPPHLTAERFRIAADFQGQVVPFKGAPEALTEVLTGRVDFYFCPLPVAMPFIGDGKLLALAVSGAKRAAALPNVPTTLESGVPNSDFDFWNGAFVPKQTPRDIVAKIHRETVATIESAAIKEKLAKLGVEPMIMTPEDFDARIAREVDIAVTLAKAANITAQ
jgi:tripartite-type tricarboxylate transporter receptor subunit TctC